MEAMWFLFTVLFVRSALSCSPGSTWREDCNLCICDDEGQSRCTMRICLHLKGSSPPSKLFKSTCIPGTEWNDGCNSCYCLKTLEAACTNNECIQDKPKNPFKLSSDICDHGNFWLNEGLLCQCIFGNPSCKRFVSPQLKPDIKTTTKCSPNSTFERNGHNCVCWSSGMGMDCKSDGISVSPVKELTSNSNDVSEEQTSNPNDVSEEQASNPNDVSEEQTLISNVVPEEQASPSFGFSEEMEHRGIATYQVKPVFRQEQNREECIPGKVILSEDGCHYCFCKATGVRGRCIDFCTD